MVPPPVIVQVPAKAPAQPGPPPPLPPGQSGPAITPPPQAAVTAQQVPPPPKKKKGRHRRAEETQAASGAQVADPGAPAQQPPAPAPTQAATSPAPRETVPQLGQVLGDSQRRDYEAQIREALDSAGRNLGSVGNHALSAQQQTLKSQVLSFIDQAREASKTDPVAARSLADRANLLSKDLLDSVR
jgi:hypothetical protein